MFVNETIHKFSQIHMTVAVKILKDDVFLEENDGSTDEDEVDAEKENKSDEEEESQGESAPKAKSECIIL